MSFSRPKVLLSCACVVALLLIWNIQRENASPPPGDSNTLPRPPAPNPMLPYAAAPSPAVVPDQKSAAPARLSISSAWKSEPAMSVAAFAAWYERFLAAAPAEREALIAEGIALARARRVTLAEWIRNDPERALAAAVPVMVRRGLPPAILELLEERVSGAGELALIGVTPQPGAQDPPQAMYRKALVKGREFYAHTYGRRENVNTLANASLHGIALNGVMAVSESPVRVLETGETAGARPLVVTAAATVVTPDTPLNLNPAAPTAIEVNGTVEVMARAEEIVQREIVLAHGEDGDDGHEHLAGNNLPGSSGVTRRPAQAWTHGTKKILLIRVDFSDLAGVPLNISEGSVPITEDYAVSRINGANGVKEFFEQNSFGKTSLTIADPVAGDSPDVTAVLRMPQSASYYATGDFTTQMHSDARAVAATAGFTVDNYDLVGVVFSNLGSLPGTKITWGGLAVVEGRNFWINGNYTFNVVAHEIGHNYGLPHSNLWRVTDGDPISPTGVSDDYDDIFDVMGSGYGFEHHFSHWNKSLLHWIPDTGVTTIASTGTYRVHRFDHAGANLANQLALKIVRNRQQDYWIGLRRGTSNASLNGGAYVLWGYNASGEGNLLDLTAPVNDLTNAALAVGATFTDSVAGITLKPVAQGGSGADEWLDVEVTLQPRISWAQDEFVVDEQGATATLTLNRDNSAAGSVSVSYTTSNGTATAPDDYASSSGSVTWANGDLTPKTITIPIVADALVEGTQSFSVTLSGVTGGAVIVNNAAATVTIADPGARDTTFTPGFVNSAVEKILMLPDGTALLGGVFGTVQGNITRGGVTRIKADGSIDPTFAVEGGFGAFDGWKRVTDMARQPDGKILICGEFTTFHGQNRSRIARLNADGTLDTSFSIGTGADLTVEALVLQPDGKILIGGWFTTFNSTAMRLLARLNADGSLDGTFTPPAFGGGANWRVESLAMQADGKALVAGTFYVPGQPGLNASLCRINANGALDTTFNGVGDGAFLSGSVQSIHDVAVQMDGSILIAGNFTVFNGTARGGFARLSSTGLVNTALGFTSNGACNSILVQPDDRVLIAGTFTTFNGVTANRLVRINGTTGAVETDFVASGGGDDEIKTLALQPDGKVLLGGSVFLNFQGSAANAPYWRFFGGLPGLPGTVQFGTEVVSGIEGGSATLSVTRTGGSSGTISVGYATLADTAGSSDFTPATGTLTWNDGDSSAKTINIAITSDGTAEGAESFLVHLGQPLRNSAILSSVQRATVNVTTAFDFWRGTHFTPLELADGNISGDLADPDGDGLSNLLEFGLALPPRTASGSNPPASTVQNISGSDYLTLTFKRRTPALDLTYSVQTNSGTLATPDWVSNAVQVGTATNNGDGTETVTYRDTATLSGASRRFMRVQVMRAP